MFRSGVRPPVTSFLLALIGHWARCIFNVTYQGAARDAASVHFRPSISRTHILVTNRFTAVCVGAHARTITFRTKIKTGHLYSAFSWELTSKALRMGSHSSICLSILPLMIDPQPQRITALWPVLNSRPTENRQLSWPGWLLTYRGGIPAPKTVTYPSTNRAQRRVTSLICTTPLPLRQTNQSINQSIKIYFLSNNTKLHNVYCMRALKRLPQKHYAL